jgi:hypothetical protein
MSFPVIDDVQFDIVDERLKIVMPVQRNWAYLGVYSVLLATWIGVTGWMLVLLFGTSISQLSTQFVIVWIIILLVWAYIWYRLGRNVWRWWQYYVATREVLFVDKDVLIIRRPLSLLGVTDAYGMEHVSPFYYSARHQSVAFDYGSRGSLFGSGIERESAQRLIKYLNDRFFPHAGEPDDY